MANPLECSHVMLSRPGCMLPGNCRNKVAYVDPLGRGWCRRHEPDEETKERWEAIANLQRPKGPSGGGKRRSPGPKRVLSEARQATRTRGKFAPMNACQVCGRRGTLWPAFGGDSCYGVEGTIWWPLERGPLYLCSKCDAKSLAWRQRQIDQGVIP